MADQFDPKRYGYRCRPSHKEADYVIPSDAKSEKESRGNEENLDVPNHPPLTEQSQQDSNKGSRNGPNTQSLREECQELEKEDLRVNVDVDVYSCSVDQKELANNPPSCKQPSYASILGMRPKTSTVPVQNHLLLSVHANPRQQHKTWTGKRLIQSNRTCNPLQALQSELLVGTAPENFKALSHENGFNREKKHKEVPFPLASGEDQAGSEARELKDRIKEAQQLSLRRITNSKRVHDDQATTSLKDLDLARTPIDSQRPKASHRRWIRVRHGCKSNRGAELGIEKSTSIGIGEKTETCFDTTDDVSSNGVDGMDTSNSIPRTTSAVDAKSDQANSCPEASEPMFQTQYVKQDLEKRPEESSGHEKVPHYDNQHEHRSNHLPRSRSEKNAESCERVSHSWLLASAKASNQTYLTNGIPYNVVPQHILEDESYHPDGIGMKKATYTISADNAQHYGYVNDVREITEDCHPLQHSDLQDWGKVDTRVPSNSQFKNETTEQLVANWNKHLEHAHTIDRPNQSKESSSPPPNLETNDETEVPKIRPPELNIYLRPAVSSDLGELARIFNWYIKNSPRPTELGELGFESMRFRLLDAAQNKLPFLVAVQKSFKNTKLKPDLEMDEPSVLDDLNRHTHVKHRKYHAVSRTESVAGFVCASDLTASDYAEHISAELELYVDPSYRRLGVGRCLMDKALEIIDRTYMPQSTYDFHCAQEERHLYGPGGGRNLHKAYFLVRKWKHPRPCKDSQTAKMKTQRMRLSRRNIAAQETNEHEDDDYDVWLKDWLRSFGFEQEGYLKGAGARNGRFLDIVYLGRETGWQPRDGRIPEPAL